jgi:putative SOS response-associated peptidase YedK
MCGRSSLHEEPARLLEAYGLPPRLPGYRPRFNITPSETQWTILRAGSNLEARGLKWGLVPSWANDPTIGSRMINARAETIAEKPSYRDALRHGRCLVITDGYYEWAKTENGKTPYRFQLAGGKPFVFAGLWDRWARGDTAIESCTIITTGAGPAASQFHPRMPVILGFEDSLRWMQPDLTARELLPLLRPYSGADLEIFEVSKAVNSPANDTEECLRAVS